MKIAAVMVGVLLTWPGQARRRPKEYNSPEQSPMWKPPPSVSRGHRTTMGISGYSGWSLLRSPVHRARRSKLWTHIALDKSSHHVSGKAVDLPEECPRPGIGQTHGAISASSVRWHQYERGDTVLMLSKHIIDYNSPIRRRLLQIQSILLATGSDSSGSDVSPGCY